MCIALTRLLLTILNEEDDDNVRFHFWFQKIIQSNKNGLPEQQKVREARLAILMIKSLLNFRLSNGAIS